MLGSGRPDLEDFLKWAEQTNHDRFRGWVGFSVAVSHRITAGCDILLMPSRFEPCGLNQLYAMRYGTIPVVHATGGLKDTVRPYSDLTEGVDGIGTGFLFAPPDVDSMMSALTAATRVYREKPERWRMLQQSCMRQDFSWNKAAKQYEQLFECAVELASNPHVPASLPRAIPAILLTRHGGARLAGVVVHGCRLGARPEPALFLCLYLVLRPFQVEQNRSPLLQM